MSNKPVRSPCGGDLQPPPYVAPPLAPGYDGDRAAPKTPAVVYSNSPPLAGLRRRQRRPSKLARIEVYFTQDGGQWQRYPDSVRPTGTVPISVAKDGRYGFILVARSNAGMAKPAPKAGDEPHLTVEVDTTAPEFTSPRPKSTTKATASSTSAGRRRIATSRTPRRHWSGRRRRPGRGR